MLERVLEPEVMDTAEEAHAYDAMDHSGVNRAFAQDFLAVWDSRGSVLDVGTGTAQIPIELCRAHPAITVVGIDLADSMLELGLANVRRAGFDGRIRLEKQDAKQLPYPDGTFGAVVSNSIIHHIPEPGPVFREMVRVRAPGGRLFVRDLIRPADEASLAQLVDLYGGTEPHARQLFADSLRAAFSVAEVRLFVTQLGFAAASVQQTTDRHWTWTA